MINMKTSVNLHNRFDLQLINSKTGEVKQVAQAENTVLDQFYQNLTDNLIIPWKVELGTGQGTPSVADTSLFKSAFSKYVETSNLLERQIQYPTSTLRFAVTFPASSSYVGNLTEIGVVSYQYTNNVLITHAMLSDSEGNPISIEKTELDILIVTVTMYLTFNVKDKNFKLYMPNGFTDAFNLFNENRDAAKLWSGLELYRHATNASSGGAFNDFTTQGAYSRSTKTYTATANRLGTAQGNNNGSTYYNAIGIRKQGYMRFPNTGIFPLYTVRNVPIGTGDGTMQDFVCPFALFVKDTDVLYKNGVALARGTDYTISNVNYHELNPCVTAGNFADISLVGIPISKGGRGHVPFTTKGDTYSEPKPSENIIVLLDMREPDPTIGRAVDGFSVKITAIHDNWGASQPPITYGCTVEYSDDNAAWHTVPVEVSSEYVGRSNFYYYTYRLTGSFTEIDAPYMRVTFSVESIPSGFSRYYTEAEGAMYKLGSPIHFNEAPAEGDVITMDCQLDRPYKSSNYVLDATMSITLE